VQVLAQLRHRCLTWLPWASPGLLLQVLRPSGSCRAAAHCQECQLHRRHRCWCGAAQWVCCAPLLLLLLHPLLLRPGLLHSSSCARLLLCERPQHPARVTV
jgi:hypothetical protein